MAVCKAVLVVFLLLKIVLGCNDHKLIVHSVKSCADESIIRNKNLSMSMDRNCLVAVSGCVMVTKAFRTAKADYSLKRGILPPLKGSVDVCGMIANPKKKVGSVLASIGFTCPGVKKTICADASKKTDISKFKQQFPAAAGKTVIIFDVEHDTGKSCIELDIEIKKL